jgi:hypothetical protein
MLSISAEFVVHGCPWVNDLISLHTGEGIRVLVADAANWSLRSYNPQSWQCVSQCRLDSKPLCLCVCQGLVLVYCEDSGLYSVTSVAQLAVTLHARTETQYERMSGLDSDHFVATWWLHPPAVDKINIKGQVVGSLTSSTSYKFTRPWAVTCHGVNTVLACDWDLSGKHHVVCLRQGAGHGGVWVLSWRHDPLAEPLSPLVMAGTVIVPCRRPNTILTLDLHTGAVLRTFSPADGCPALSWGSCVVGDKLFVGCSNADIVEFRLQGERQLLGSCRHQNYIIVGDDSVRRRWPSDVSIV